MIVDSSLARTLSLVIPHSAIYPPRTTTLLVLPYFRPATACYRRRRNFQLRRATACSLTSPSSRSSRRNLPSSPSRSHRANVEASVAQSLSVGASSVPLQPLLVRRPFEAHSKVKLVVSPSCVLCSRFLASSLHRSAVRLTVAAKFVVAVRQSSWFIVLEGPPLICPTPASPGPSKAALRPICSSPASCHLSLSLKSLLTALAKGNVSNAQSVLSAGSWLMALLTAR
ncbi:uncharacterized protein DS421_13g423450 [Arachis hypogaea]|nr:uncharacterized protein DS421_13g423450 [Arachis hypogaea]